MRALKAVGLKPTVFHMNEGHSAFLVLEQVRHYMGEDRLSFEEALEAARSSNVFTTHTPVPAGIDLFDPGMMYHYFFPRFCAEIGIDFNQLMGLGRRNPLDRDERFFNGRAGAEDVGLPECGEPAAPAHLAGNVPRPVAAIARFGKSRSLRSPTVFTRRAG